MRGRERPNQAMSDKTCVDHIRAQCEIYLDLKDVNLLVIHHCTVIFIDGLIEA